MNNAGKKYMRSLTFFTSCLVSLAFTASLSASPTSIIYQGSLKQSGTSVNGTYSMIFSITNADGSQVYWTSGSISTVIKEGLYRAELTPSGVDWGNVDPYIETRVNGTLLLPREKLSNAPYALIAKDLVPGSIHATDGSATAPAFSFVSDPNTGIYRPAADTFTIATGGVDALTVDSLHNINIGPATQEGNLNVKSPAGNSCNISFDTGDNTKPAFIQFDSAGTPKWFVQSKNHADAPNDRFAVISRSATGDNEVMTMLPNGNVGIGTANPGASLDVNGSLSVTGTIQSTAATLPIAIQGNVRAKISNNGMYGYSQFTAQSTVINIASVGSGTEWIPVLNSKDYAFTVVGYAKTFSVRLDNGDGCLVVTNYLTSTITIIGATSNIVASATPPSGKFGIYKSIDSDVVHFVTSAGATNTYKQWGVNFLGNSVSGVQ